MPEKKERYTARLEKLLFHPKKFYSEAEKEKNYSDIMFFYIKVAVFNIILGFILSIIEALLGYNLTAAGTVSLLSSLVVNIGMAFAITFVWAGVTHLGVLIFRGKQKYFNTYKPIAYSLAIMAAYGVLMTLTTTILTILFSINITQISSLSPEQILQHKEVIYMLIITYIILAISLVHTFYTQVISLSKFQKISKLRAALSILIIPAVLFVLFFAVITFLVMKTSIG